MSGNSIGTIIGGAVGFMLAPATAGASLAWMSYGMSIGGIAGGLLMPDQVGLQDQTGPRLTDLKISTSVYGAPINRVYGSYRIPGNIIWAKELKETEHVEEVEVGKGGSETYDVITYTYSIDMAIGFCVGEVDAILKIWADSVLIYDVNQGGFSSKFTTTEQTSGDIQFYLGGSDQEIDWYMQSQEEDSPAYRNLCYIRFKDFQLDLFGNRVPNITCEVSHASQKTMGPRTTILAVEQETQSLNTTVIISADRSKVRYVSGNYDAYHTNIHWTVYDRFNDTNSKVVQVIPEKLFDEDDNLICEYDNYRIYSNDFRTDIDSFFLGILPELYLVNIGETCEMSSKFDFTGDTKTISTANESSAYITETHVYLSLAYNYGSAESSPFEIYGYDLQGVLHNRVDYEPEQVFETVEGFVVVRVYNNFVYSISSDNATKFITVVKYDLNLNLISKYTTTEESPAQLSYPPCIDIEAGYIHIFDSVNYGHVELETGVVSQLYPISQFYRVNGSLFNEGTIYSTKLHTHEDLSPPPDYDTLKIDYTYVNGVSKTTTTLASVIEDLLLSSGIQNYDVSEGLGIPITGFNIPNPANARSSVSVLQIAYSFDLIEENFQIKLKLRSSDKIILSESAILDSFSASQKLDTDIPYQVIVKYQSIAIDYQNSSQISTRLGSNSHNKSSIELPMVLSDTEAKQIAEINLYKAWSGKCAISFEAPLFEAQVGSLVSIVYDGIAYDIRIASITYTTDNIMQCTGVDEKDNVLASSAIGTDTSEGFHSPVIAIYEPTDLYLFNSNSLDNTTLNAFGIYYAVRGFSDSWKGCTINKSTDGGATFNDSGAILESACFGTVIGVVSPTTTTTTWDLSTSITLRTQNNHFESSTNQSLLAGANYIKVGMEILQYKNVTDNLDDTYTLDTLLRGRRGTESEVNLHVENEDFVLLNHSAIQFSPSTLNVETIYKAVTFDTYAYDAYEELIVYDGTNLKPFSVSYVNSNYDDATGDATISWVRRDRYISGHMRALPMSETLEVYEIDVYYQFGGIKETIQVLTPELAYNLIIDTRLIFKIYQISEAIGRGYPAEILVGIPNLYKVPNDQLSSFEGDTSDWVYDDNGYHTNLTNYWGIYPKTGWDAGNPNVLKIKPEIYDNKIVIGIKITINSYYDIPSGGLHESEAIFVYTDGGSNRIFKTLDSAAASGSGQYLYDSDGLVSSGPSDYIDLVMEGSVLEGRVVDYILIRSNGYTSSYPITDNGIKDIEVYTV